MKPSADSLRQNDFDQHARLGIPPELLAAVAQRVTDKEAREILGVKHTGDLAGLVYARLDPESGHVRGYRLRRDHPEVENGKPRNKYLSSVDRAAFFFPPDIAPFLADITITVVFVEAEKSSLSLTGAALRTGRRLLAIGTGGCWGWRGRTGKVSSEDGTRVDETGPLPDFDRIVWRDRDVVVMFDANAAASEMVQAARRGLTRELAARGASVRVAELRPEDFVNGPDDYLAKHGDAALLKFLDAAESTSTRARSLKFVVRHQEKNATASPASGPQTATHDRGGRESQATVLLKLASASGVVCFRDDDVAYLRIQNRGHQETLPLRSRLGRAWLQGLYIDARAKCAGAQAIADVSNALEAFALRGDEHRVYIRIASTDEAIYLDLADSSWCAIEIRATGWRIVSGMPVHFRRPKGLLPLQVPRSGGSITTLRPFVNVASDDDFVLVVMLLVATLRARGPYPTLVTNGEQGSAKSTLTRIVKALVDPNIAPLRSEPREPRDLMIAAANNHVLAFDNLSSIPPWLSDCFCRLATGGGFSTRMLYENAEEQIFSAMRPLVINGIPELATRPDLVSRALLLSLPRITEQQYRDEKTFWTAFEAAQPEILGALLDIVVGALAHEDEVHLQRTPRMADFARWSVAAETACPWRAGTFMEVYAGNRQQAADLVLDGDAVAEFVRVLIGSAGTWTGTASDFLEGLNRGTPETTQRRSDWFKRPRQISDALRRLAPALRQVGIDVRFTKAGHKRTRLIELEGLNTDASASSADSTVRPAREDAADVADAVPPPHPHDSRLRQRVEI